MKKKTIKKALPTQSLDKDTPKFRNKIGKFFLKIKDHLQFVSTGCSLLDMILGGGFPIGKVVNIVGDSHCGKTLIAIEACVNFLRKYADGVAYYHEGESAFDEAYAQALGLDLSRTILVDNPPGTKNTLEDLDFQLAKIIKEKQKLRKSKSKEDRLRADAPVTYVVDSYDSFGLNHKSDVTDYTPAKCAKYLAEILGKYVKELEINDILLIIISQVRQNIDPNPYAPKKRRNGGEALKFYSSQEFWLAEAGRFEKTYKGEKYRLGLKIAAHCTKNRVGLEYRNCNFFIRFSFGIDDIHSNLEWLKKYSNVECLGFKKDSLEEQVREIYRSSDRKKISKKIADKVAQEWWKREEALMLTEKKY